MLTGINPPSSGDAWVSGKSINTEIEGVHKNMGVCP
jgi:ABC-type multidrug transport system ATPase subunit